MDRVKLGCILVKVDQVRVVDDVFRVCPDASKPTLRLVIKDLGKEATTLGKGIIDFEPVHLNEGFPLSEAAVFHWVEIECLLSHLPCCVILLLLSQVREVQWAGFCCLLLK